MNSFCMGFHLTNLIIPEEPEILDVKTPEGTWVLTRSHLYLTHKNDILEGKCAETYSIWVEKPCAGSRSAAMDSAFDELVPLCLGASYLTGLSVAPSRSLHASEIKFAEVGPHFPRPRAMGDGFPLASDNATFLTNLEEFVAAYYKQGTTENIRLISHHFLDALAFWSLEDLVLSTATILEIISCTAKRIAASQGNPIRNFTQRMHFAANRFNLPPLPMNFRKMRNDLVHEGTLSGSNFPNANSIHCGKAVEEALDWIDLYLFSALGMTPPKQPRFINQGFSSVNSFSL